MPAKTVAVKDGLGCPRSEINASDISGNMHYDNDLKIIRDLLYID